MIQGGGFTGRLHPPGDQPDGALGVRQWWLPNLRSTIAMARTGDPHSAGTQFFINVVNNVADDPETANLDPVKHATQGRWGYTVFGFVTEGMDVVDLIAQYETDPNGPGGAPAPIIPVIIENMTRVQRGHMATLFISDLHLEPGRPEIGEQFLAFLAGPARRCRCTVHPGRPVRGLDRRRRPEPLPRADEDCDPRTLRQRCAGLLHRTVIAIS